MTTMVRCPRCGQSSDRIKASRLGFLLFLGIGARWERRTEYGCPTCTRKLIAMNTLLNLPFANLLWPLFILPVNIYYFIQSYSEGHSDAVLQQLRYASARNEAATMDAIRRAMQQAGQGSTASPKRSTEPIFADYFKKSDQG